MNVREIWKKRAVKGTYGIEIEVEGYDLPEAPAGWREDEDGSLRGESKEYVFDGPADLDDMWGRLEALASAYEECGSEINDSVRCGVHVHINVQKLTMTELANFIVLYLVMEPALVKWCGEHREGNLFCLRMQDADFFMHHLLNIFKYELWARMTDENYRYASVNICAVPKYGSLEFRAMRGTNDLDTIGEWAVMLGNLRDAATKYTDPAAIMQDFSQSGPEKFLTNAVGMWAPRLMKGDWEALLRKGMRGVQMIAFGVDWEAEEGERKKKKKKPYYEYRGAQLVNEGVAQAVIPNGVQIRAHPRPMGDADVQDVIDDMVKFNAVVDEPPVPEPRWGIDEPDEDDNF